MQPIDDFVAGELAAVADPEKVAKMQAYMKTDMPFYGVQKAGRTPILRALKKQYRPADADAWRDNVLALWRRPHREEKYLALQYARAFKAHQVRAHLPLFEQLIREGQWWDFVDDVAVHLVGGTWKGHRAAMTPVMRRWIEDEDLWIRRTAIIGQLKHREETDVPLLLDFCRQQAADKTFWIRKAIGWALREHSKRDPEPVRAFLAEMGDGLSGLSRREASKYL